MATAARPVVNRAPVERPGPFGQTLALLSRFASWLLLGLVSSIVVDWLGLTFWWPDEGVARNAQMYRDELAFLADGLQPSRLLPDPPAYAVRFAELVHDLLWVETGLIHVVDWMASPPPPDASALEYWLHRVSDYAVSVVYSTKLFAIRLAILTLAMPIFVIFGLVGLIDGLVERDIRKWSGGRESGYIFHIAKGYISPMFFLSWSVYLAIPITIHPALVILPFATLFGLMLRTTAAKFKKYV